MDAICHTDFSYPFVMTFHGALTMRRAYSILHQTLRYHHLVGYPLGTGSDAFRSSYIALVNPGTDGSSPVRSVSCGYYPSICQLILGSLDSPLSPTADWRARRDPQPSDFGDIVGNYKDGRMMGFNSIEPCGRGIPKVNVKSHWKQPSLGVSSNIWMSC